MSVGGRGGGRGRQGVVGVGEGETGSVRGGLGGPGREGGRTQVHHTLTECRKWMG
jgi:hypothetical protein